MSTLIAMEIHHLLVRWHIESFSTWHSLSSLPTIPSLITLCISLLNSPELAALPLPELLQRLGEVPAALRTALRNSGGGYVNHELFWKVRIFFYPFWYYLFAHNIVALRIYIRYIFSIAHLLSTPRSWRPTPADPPAAPSPTPSIPPSAPSTR